MSHVSWLAVVQITVQLYPLQPTLREHMLQMVSFSAFLSRTILQDSLTTITFSSEGFVRVLKNSSREWRHFRRMNQNPVKPSLCSSTFHSWDQGTCQTTNLCLPKVRAPAPKVNRRHLFTHKGRQ